MIALKHLCREFDVDPPKLRRTLRNANLTPTGRTMEMGRRKQGTDKGKGRSSANYSRRSLVQQPHP
jgi:hypothetical protein